MSSCRTFLKVQPGDMVEMVQRLTRGRVSVLLLLLLLYLYLFVYLFIF